MRRRTLLKHTALAAAAAALGEAHVAAARLALGPRSPEEDPDVTWDKAPCRFCGTGCHVQVGVRDGRVVAIAGDAEAEAAGCA
jgi:nitrate reductase NapA